MTCRLKKKYKRRFSSHCFHYIWKKLWAIPWRWLKHLFCNFLSVQFCLLLFLSLFCRFFVISVLACNFVCHVPNNFWYFPYFWDNCTNKWPKKRQTNPPNDKNDKKVTILQVAKMTFFSKHCIFLSFFCHCSNTFNMIEKCAKITKNDKNPLHDKNTQNMTILQVAKITFFSKHCLFLPFFCHFGAIFSKNMQKYQTLYGKYKHDKIRTILQVAKIAFFLRYCHFSGHFSAMSVQFSQKNVKISKKYSKNDSKMTNNDNASRKMTFLQPAKSSSFRHFWSFGGFFCHFLVILAHFSNILKNISKLFEQWQKNDNALRKMHNLCNLQNCHCFFFVIVWSFLCNFAKNMDKDQKVFGNWQERTMLREKGNFCNLQNDKTWQTKWQTKTLMTKKWRNMTNKIEITKNGKNDRQNWNDKKSQQK